MKGVRKHYGLLIGFALIASAIVVAAFVVRVRGTTVINEYQLRLKDENGKVADFSYGSLPSLTNPDYYQNVRTQLIGAQANFIDADLNAMKLGVYKKGVLVLEVPIAARGVPGSWSDTPSGLYRAENKVKSHRSSFEPVTMSWNIPFQGNYFIHGWPKFNKTGKPVTSDYSAGCIRLTDENAKKVYDLAEVGMPILVHEQTTKDTFSYDVNIPNISGATYLAADLDNNFVFLQKNQNISYLLADFAKFLNAFVVSEYLSYDRSITITPQMIEGKRNSRLVVKESYTPYDLMFPLIIEKADEVAEALASAVGRERFIDLMSRKAQALGMEGTAIVDPAGTVNANVTTARDIFQLAKAVTQYRRFLLDMTVDIGKAMTDGPIAFKNIGPNNPLATEAGYIGGMITRGNNGTESIVAVYVFDFKGSKRPIAIISMDSKTPVDDVRAMMMYIQRTYK